MKEEYHKWNTLYLNKEFEMLVFGNGGFPIVLFPPSQERYYAYKDNSVIQSFSDLLDENRIKIYCPDSLDSESWYNYSIHPADRVKTHISYENVILHDVIDFALYESERKKLLVAGSGFGAYHALNFGFKHPDKVEGIICIGGFFDIKRFIFGYYDDNCYFNNPPDYLPNLEDPWYLDRIRAMKIILSSTEWDSNKEETKRLSNILNNKGIPHKIEIRKNMNSDWQTWNIIFPEYIRQVITHLTHYPSRSLF